MTKDIIIPLTDAQVKRLQNLQNNVQMAMGMRDNAFAILLESQSTEKLGVGWTFEIQDSNLIAHAPPALQPEAPDATPIPA